MGDSISILRCRGDGKYHAQKTFRYDGKTINKHDFSAGKYFRCFRRSVNSIYTLASLLERVELDPYSFVVRGKPLDFIDHNYLVRRKQGDQACFEDEPHQWVCFDIDEFPEPFNNETEALQRILACLPQSFQDVTFWYQFSASQGVKTDTINVHLWFWLDQPYTSRAIKRWVVNYNRKLFNYQVLHGYSVTKRLIDESLFQEVQPHYTARPQFINMRDPLDKRSGMWQGSYDYVELPAMPDQPVLEIDRQTGSVTDTGQIGEPVGFEAFLNEIGGAHGYREPLRSAICSYIATVEPDERDYELMKDAIRNALIDSGLPNDNADKYNLYRSDKHLNAIIKWAEEQNGG